ncbi:PAS domain S-box protein [Celeribacter indicus]|uniref:histidine kinase n=1 Tax=Celeribacter indicus TaxID=1208324 RepID=A0A0B5DUN0_9RHOB|nr:PAS domain S-box protein [Celeribacter indicus]AJE46729.1 putative sensor histidine kinase [Celeribacter indicus]SDX04982.1 PAS domain S-box-containing protein [Celeribacter indicus]
MDSQESLQQHLAAIVEGSEDAIITKNLDSVILSWNRGAERLFGYSAQEAIGQPITLIFPEDRKDEELDFITRLRRGERIAHFETVRRRKNGSLVPISLTVSPVRNAEGRVVGASKIARDITLQHRVAEQQQLLLSEMRHRVGNSFAVAGGLLALAARQTDNVADLVTTMRRRLHALASVHSMALVDPSGDAPERCSLVDLVGSVLDPFAGERPLRVDLPDLPVCSAAITPLALVFFELATNAVKYGGLSETGTGVAIRGECRDGRLFLRWEETRADAPAPAPARPDRGGGFGTRMCESTVSTSLGGSFSRSFTPEGMVAELDLDLTAVTGEKADAPSRDT